MARSTPFTKKEMIHKAVESSNVKSIAFDEKSSVLEVKYKTSKGVESTYQYHPITQEGYNELMNSKSKGTWVHENIRKNTRIETVKIN